MTHNFFFFLMNIMKKKFMFIVITIIVIVSIIYILMFDIKILTVSGTSMNPSITQDDVVIVSPVDIKYLKIGDIITYRRNIDGKSVTITHRIVDIIVDINGGIIKTKGDSLSSEDRYDVNSKNIVGKVIGKIPYIGYLIRLVRTNTGYLIFILIPSIMLILREIKNMANKSKN